MANYQTPNQPKLFVYAIIIVLLFGVMALLTRRMFKNENPGGFRQDRAEERLKARHGIEAATKAELTTPGWIDQGKGIVRIPIAQAMELTVQNWGKNPAAARSNLIARAQKAAAPAPKAPEPPSKFE